MATIIKEEVVSVISKNSLQAYEGMDRLVGRPIRLNKQRLEVKPGKCYAELMFCGDWHIGYPSCLVEDIIGNLDYCRKKNVYLLLMGDLMEAGTRDSVGDSVFRQILDPQSQLERVVEILRPLAEAGLILGSYRGNHENRILKTTGMDAAKIICNMLHIPYLGGAMWNLLYVGGQSYKVYAMHGKSGSRMLWTKVKAVSDIAQNVAPNAHIVAMGHVHENVVVERDFMDVSPKRKKVVQPKRFVVLTGHYLGYDDSYAQESGMGLGRKGSPKFKLFADKFDIHASQ
jgi:UDP-2,3-diacylglucosamine pyrophosphatase LpxH